MREELEILLRLTAGQRERVMGHYTLGKEQPGLAPRALASGVSGVVHGFRDMEEARAVVAELEAGNALKDRRVPIPKLWFSGAAETFPAAANYLAVELSNSKKLSQQVSDALKGAGAEARQQSPEAKQRSAESKQRSAESRQHIAETKKRIAKSEAEIARYAESLKTIQALLKATDAAK
ncbi:hypothetical protein [uncultured Thiodictyon sp.]|uniref:hypothetical protein n=1 Tax=uncultured Thiodictyon sp. TaxID=1846217 RepID=UPI0025D971D0|nr:hypothetical protein [uncultured Thiodictyon sp.]